MKEKTEFELLVDGAVQKLNEATKDDPDPHIEIAVRVYKPEQDWSGLGYKHWLVVAIGKSGSRAEGAGRDFKSAFVELANHSEHLRWS